MYLMDHNMKPNWFIRLLAWLDFAIEFTLAAIIFTLAFIFIASLVEMRAVETFLAGLLFGAY